MFVTSYSSGRENIVSTPKTVNSVYGWKREEEHLKTSKHISRPKPQAKSIWTPPKKYKRVPAARPLTVNNDWAPVIILKQQTAPSSEKQPSPRDSHTTATHTCASCSSTQTSQWRIIAANVHCNACYAKLRRWAIKYHRNIQTPEDAQEGFGMLGITTSVDALSKS